MKEAVKDAVDSEKFNGYGPAHGKYSIFSDERVMKVRMAGLLCTRQAVAKHHSTPEAALTEDVSR